MLSHPDSAEWSTWRSAIMHPSDASSLHCRTCIETSDALDQTHVKRKDLVQNTFCAFTSPSQISSATRSSIHFIPSCCRRRQSRLRWWPTSCSLAVACSHCAIVTRAGANVLVASNPIIWLTSMLLRVESLCFRSRIVSDGSPASNQNHFSWHVISLGVLEWFDHEMNVQRTHSNATCSHRRKTVCFCLFTRMYLHDTDSPARVKQTEKQGQTSHKATLTCSCCLTRPAADSSTWGTYLCPKLLACCSICWSHRVYL